MTNDEGNPNDEVRNTSRDAAGIVVKSASFIRHSTFVLRHLPSHPLRRFDAEQLETFLQYASGQFA
jgi:hypothetical protein